MSATPGVLKDFLPPLRHLAAIGKVCAIWSLIENSMETIILGLYEIDLGRGLIFTNNLSFQTRTSLLTVLAKEGGIADEALAKEMEAILPRIEEGQGLRNAIVHALWAPGPKSGVIRRLAMRTRAKKIKTYNVRSLEAINAILNNRIQVALKQVPHVARKFKPGSPFSRD